MRLTRFIGRSLDLLPVRATTIEIKLEAFLLPSISEKPEELAHVRKKFF
jgi:hypothetical protein